MEELDIRYIKDFLIRISEDIEEREKRFNKAKNLEEHLKMIEIITGIKVYESDFVKLYNEVFEVNKEYIEKLKLIYDKYNKKYNLEEIEDERKYNSKNDVK